MHPYLIRFGPLTIYSYGAMLLVGFLAGLWWARREGRRRGIASGAIVDLSLWMLFGSLLFARIFFVLLNLAFYRSQPLSALFLGNGHFAIQGLSFHGGLFGAMLGSFIFCRRARLSWLLLADIMAPAAALGYGFGRIGCFLNGCCYGAPTHLPWGTRFLIDPETGVCTPPSHPTQIYAALGSWAIFGLLLLLRNKLPGKGQLAFSYLALYSVLRFGVEFFRRGSTAIVSWGGLTQAQIASIIIFVIALVLIFYLRPRPSSRKAS
jgi:phosphatidylglycerol---prolipoprotein diacylglyceryl transferase